MISVTALRQTIFVLPNNHETFQRYEVVFKSHLDQRMGRMLPQVFVGLFSEGVRDCWSKRHAFDVWCGLQSSGGGSYVNTFCRLPVGSRALFLWEITVISVSSDLIYNLPETKELIASDILNRQKFHFALLCGDTQRSCVLNPYQSSFPCRSFIWKKPLKSVLWDGDASLDLLIARLAPWLEDKHVWQGHLWAFGLSK